MIKPFYKHEHNASIVEVEEFGEINLSELPIRIHLEKAGNYEIGWVGTVLNGEKAYLLSEYGGTGSFNFGGRSLGVINIVKYG